MYTLKYLDKLITIKFTDLPTTISGFVIAVSNDWTLLKYNVFDYVIDGYVIVRHKNIAGIIRTDKERFIEKVIKIKQTHLSTFQDFPLTDLQAILSKLSSDYGIFQFYLKRTDIVYLGRLIEFNKSKFTINYINPKGVWSKQMEFRSGDVRVIEFETDYCNSLMLFSKSKKRKTSRKK